MFSRFSRPGIAPIYLGTIPRQFLSEFCFTFRLTFSELAKDSLFQPHAYATTKQELPHRVIGVFRMSAYNPPGAGAPNFSCDHV